jgi:hypothetical protein
LPSIPFAQFDGTTDARPSGDLMPEKVKTATGEEAQSTNREPLQELLDMSDGILSRDFGTEGPEAAGEGGVGDVGGDD